MPERYQRGVNWALMFTMAMSAISGVWLLAGVASDVSSAKMELKGIREDFKAIQIKVQELDKRTSLLEARGGYGNEWRNRDKGPTQ